MFLGLEKVWTFCSVLGKLFPRLTAEGHRDSKKIYRWKCGLQKEVSGRLAPAGIPGCCYALDVALGRHQQIRRPLLNHSGIQSKGFVVAQHRYDMVTVGFKHSSAGYERASIVRDL